MDENPNDNTDLEDTTSSNSPTQTTNSNDKLDNVKSRALDALTPLIDSLDVGPERKFDICISAMRFTDNKDLAEAALDAALAIEEKGTKAEALVELVNEINYLEQNTA